MRLPATLLSLPKPPRTFLSQIDPHAQLQNTIHNVLKTTNVLLQVGAVLGSGGTAIGQVRAESGACVRLVPLEPEEARLLPTPMLCYLCHLLLLRQAAYSVHDNGGLWKVLPACTSS